MKKVALFFAMVFFQTIAFCQSPFQGEWYWEDDFNSFTLTLEINQSTAKGTLCSIMQQGNRIDCGDSDESNFIAEVSGNKIVTPFTSYYCNCTGKVEITLIDAAHLKWKITEKPKGDYFIPDEVVLVKATPE